jgi:hypothetical protein
MGLIMSLKNRLTKLEQSLIKDESKLVPLVLMWPGDDEPTTLMVSPQTIEALDKVYGQ